MSNTVTACLLTMGEEPYRCFTAGLLPTVAADRVIGVRTPVLRRLAKELHGSEQAAVFMAALPHRYYEENNLHAFLIEHIRDLDDCLAALERFLPYIDNWATCDCLSPPVLKKHPDALLERIPVWLGSSHTYTVRFGLNMLMRHFLEEHFRPEYLDMAAGVAGEDYYLRMMVAWYFATALAKQYEAALPYIEGRRLPRWTHNKAIQKAVESRRISPQQKAYLKTLRWK